MSDNSIGYESTRQARLEAENATLMRFVEELLEQFEFGEEGKVVFLGQGDDDAVTDECRDTVQRANDYLNAGDGEDDIPF